MGIHQTTVKDALAYAPTCSSSNSCIQVVVLALVLVVKAEGVVDVAVGGGDVVVAFIVALHSAEILM